MVTRKVFIGCCMLGGLVFALAACSSLNWWRDEPAAKGVTSEMATTATAEREDQEAALRQIVRDRVAAAPAAPDDRHGQFVRRKPYFYKEYSVYPNGPDSATVSITKTESRTAPLTAKANLSKLRFATRLHRKKDDARSDNDYLRETGTETLSYECRNGKWVLVGSLFVVDKTEENVNGEWVPLQQEILRRISAEEDGNKGWFGRTWSRLTGQD